MKKSVWIVLICLGGCLCAGFFSFRFRNKEVSLYNDAGWGQGKLKASERYYYQYRYREIMDRWRDLTWNHKSDGEGRLGADYQVYLHIDLDKEALWLEENGQVRPADYMELPGNMTWHFHHLTENAVTKLPNKVYLKCRGEYTDRLTPELFYLIGNGRGNDHCSFSIESANGNRGYGSGPGPTIKPLGERRTEQGKELYGSILMSDEEIKNSLKKRDSAPLPTFDEKSVNWRSAFKKLYQQIEIHADSHEYDLRKIECQWADDLTAVLIKADCEGQESRLDFLPFRWAKSNRSDAEFLFKADHLGEGVWYTKSYPFHDWTRLGGNFPDIEFLVHDFKALNTAEQQQWIQQGRRKQSIQMQPGSPWKATLSDGSIVHFLGVHTGSLAGGQWWGPDGSTLETHPIFYNKFPGQNNGCHILLGIKWADGTISSKLKSYFDDRSAATQSRGGRHGEYEILSIQYSPHKPQTHVAMKQLISINGGKEETIIFSNISLSAGNDYGFEIRTGE